MKTRVCVGPEDPDSSCHGPSLCLLLSGCKCGVSHGDIPGPLSPLQHGKDRGGKNGLDIPVSQDIVSETLFVAGVVSFEVDD